MAVPEALVFDLFGTLVFFDDTRVPWVEVAGRRMPGTVASLPQLLAEALPGCEPRAFLQGLARVSAAIAEQKSREGIELHSSVRFERTLVELGAEAAVAASVAKRMAAEHMDALARAIVCPPGRADLLRDLSRAHRLALLSNFDDGATGRRILAEAGLLDAFEVVVISEEEGIRKPAGEIFARTCGRLGVAPGDCLYLGDTLVEDIEGATAAGLRALWVGSSAGSRESPAVGVLADVAALPGWLAHERRRE